MIPITLKSYQDQALQTLPACAQAGAFGRVPCVCLRIPTGGDKMLHASTPHPDAPLVVYGEANRLGPETLARARVTFKHIPYDVKAR